MERITDGGRVLTELEQALADYLGNERQAIALAPQVAEKLTWEEGLNSTTLERAVTRVLVDALEATHGLDTAEYVGGQRRDTLRG